MNPINFFSYSYADLGQCSVVKNWAYFNHDFFIMNKIDNILPASLWSSIAVITLTCVVAKVFEKLFNIFMSGIIIQSSNIDTCWFDEFLRKKNPGSSLAWVRWVHLHPRFLRNIIIINKIFSNRSICKYILEIYD